MTWAKAAAQAKVNLGLRILSREPSGYHQLETFFHRLELADEVAVRRTEGERALVCTGPALPPEGLGPARANLAWRAAAAYGDAAGWEGGFHIELVKRIPVGGGLGGGSADAAAVLRACEALNPRPLGDARLHSLAGALGADVPFLVSDAPAALATGRGESLTPVAALPRCAVALVVPGFGVSTRDAYAWLAAKRGTYRPRLPVLRAGLLGDWRAIAGAAVNDFEPVVGERHPEIPAIIDALRAHGASVAMMSGSGSTVFGVYEDEEPVSARELVQSLPGEATVIWTWTANRVVPVQRTG